MSAETNTGHPRRWAILAVLVVSLLIVVLDNTVLNVAMRTIGDSEQGLGATQAQLEWAINAYTLVFAGLLFTAGVIGDRIGRRRMLLLGLLLFGLSSVVSAYAQSPTQLIFARGLMGVGAAGIMPSTLAIISNVFDPRERGKAIGFWAGSVGLAIAIGPVIGGALLEHFWWGSVFLINVPIVLFGLVAVGLIVPESRDPRPGRIDFFGVALSIVGLLALVYGIIYGGQHGFDHLQAWVAMVGGAAILAYFIVTEARSDHPSLDVALFRDSRFSAAVASVGLVFFAAMGTIFFLSFYLQVVRGYSPLRAGLLMTPFAVAQLFFAPRSAAMVARFGPRRVCAVGLGLVTVGLAGFVWIGAASSIWVMIVFTFIQGAGMANVMPPVTETIMASLPREKAGVGSAIQNTVRQVGGALGIAVLGSVLSAVYRSQITPVLDKLAGPTGLPADARENAAESILGAYGVAKHAVESGYPQAAKAAAELLPAANSSFVTAMHWAAGGSALVALLSIGVVLRWLPERSGGPARPRRAGTPSDSARPGPARSSRSGSSRSGSSRSGSARRR